MGRKEKTMKASLRTYLTTSETTSVLGAVEFVMERLKWPFYTNDAEEGVEGRFKTRYEQLKEWKKNHLKTQLQKKTP